MNDLELAQSVSTAIGKRYFDAKAVSQEHPRYSLIIFRDVCELICRHLIETKNLAISKNNDISSLIRDVCNRLNADKTSKNALDQLRLIGNKGAHPEEYKLDTAAFYDLFSRANKYAIQALKFTFLHTHPDKICPDEITIEPANEGMKSLCHRAIASEETDAQYWIGKHYLAKAGSLIKTPYSEDNLDHFLRPGKIDKEFKKATFWFEQAAEEEHPDALFEYGKLLVEGVKGEHYIGHGATKIFEAAELGHIEANVHAGNILYQGLFDWEQDLPAARKHYEIAAMADHPSALTMLGYMCMHGEGGPTDEEMALAYTRKSAEAGYPTAQYNLFVHLWNGKCVDPDRAQALVWLKKSADQNQPDALYALASHIENGTFPSRSENDAKDLYRRCLESVHENHDLWLPARIGYARMLSHETTNLQSLTACAKILQSCYEKLAGTGYQASECENIGIAVISNMKQLIKSGKGSPEEIQGAEIIVNFYFDKLGKPLKNKGDGTTQLFKTLKKAGDIKRKKGQKEYENFLLKNLMPNFNSSLQKQTTIEKFGRKQPCPCGSGKKFKRCCGANG